MERNKSQDLLRENGRSKYLREPAEDKEIFDKGNQ